MIASKEARSSFQLSCSTCHKRCGNGKASHAYIINPNVRSFMLPESRRWLNRPTLFKDISQDSQGTEMFAWNKSLNDQEIADIAEFVFQRFTRPKQLLNEAMKSGKQ